MRNRSVHSRPGHLRSSPITVSYWCPKKPEPSTSLFMLPCPMRNSISSVGFESCSLNVFKMWLEITLVCRHRLSCRSALEVRCRKFWPGGNCHCNVWKIGNRNKRITSSWRIVKQEQSNIRKINRELYRAIATLVPWTSKRPIYKMSPNKKDLNV